MRRCGSRAHQAAANIDLWIADAVLFYQGRLIRIDPGARQERGVEHAHAEGDPGDGQERPRPPGEEASPGQRDERKHDPRRTSAAP